MSDLKSALQTHQNLRAQLLEAFPDLADDEPALTDTLEGISRLDQQIVTVLRHALGREARAVALDEMIKRMMERRTRLQDGAKRLRSLALNAMQEAGLPKIEAPDMTISVGKGRQKVMVTDEGKLPFDYLRAHYSPDLPKIGEALKAGKVVHGCHLGNSSPILTVRQS
jgi:hypothetical protein